MPEDKGLYQTILDNPDDDTPRLVYADWLEEHGDSLQAQFIRADCELARLPRRDPRRDEAWKRQHALWLQYEPTWRKALPDWTWYLRIQLRRGFGGVVYTSAYNFLKHGKRLMRFMPIQEASLGNATPYLERLTRFPPLEKLRTLVLGAVNLDDRGARLLVDCPHFTNLHELIVPGPTMTPAEEALLRKRFGSAFQFTG
jgi:uncharacterized protein (TIGR02996 family)